MNPYDGLNFFSFLWQLIARFWDLLRGQLLWHNLASDEIQIIVLCGVAVSSALVGVFLVLRKMTMLANSLSHTILLGIVIAFVLTQNDSHNHSLNIFVLIIAALLVGLATTYLTELLTKTAKLQEDASIGLVFTTLFAAGIILATILTRSAHIGLEAVMGNADALHLDDCTLIFTILIINIIIFSLFFKEFSITTFDPTLSYALGISPLLYNYLLMTQVSTTAIGAFRAVGVLMVLAFITGPPLIARMLTHNLKSMLLLAITIGCLASILGVALSRHMLSIHGLSLSTGGVVVCTITAFFSFKSFLPPSCC